MARLARPAISTFAGVILLVGTSATAAHADNSAFSLKINFGTQATVAPAGYVADFGQPFDTTRTFGWTGLDGAPLNLVGNGRERNTLSDKRLDSYMHMEYGGAPSNGTLVEGKWEAIVPNGDYTLTIGVGDPAYLDSRHIVRAEGKTIVDFTPTAATTNTIITGDVTVADGKLTLDQTGGDNTKIGFIDIVGKGAIPTQGTAFKRVDFGLSTTTPATGYVLDSGLAYNASRGYGWETLTGTALDLNSETRDRATGGDPRLDTIVHMQSGRTTEGRWQLVVPNGTYNVTVGIGDPAYTDSRHVIRAEGNVIADFTPNATQKTAIATASVVVTDGKLTLDQVGGANTKIGFVDVVTLDTTPVPPIEQPAPATLQITTDQSYLNLGNVMIWSTANELPTAAQKATIKNAGSSPVTIANVGVEGQDAASFRMVAPAATTIPAGSSTTVIVAFEPKKTEANIASLKMSTNVGVIRIHLGGMNAIDLEDIYEPSLQSIVDTFGFNLNVGVADEATNFISKSKGAVGDEIISPYFTAADRTAPVYMRPLAAYAGRSTALRGPFGVNAQNSLTNTKALFSYPGGSDVFGGQNQKLLPQTNAASGFLPSEFNSTNFGIWDGPGKNFSDDELNTSMTQYGLGQKLHTMRIYPAKLASGVVVPNSYVVAVDSYILEANYKNFDFQDDVFLLQNVVPATVSTPGTTTTTTSAPSTTTTTTPSTTVPPASSTSVNLEFNAVSAGTILDKAGLGTGFTSVQSGSTHNRNNLSLLTANGHLAITSASGTNNGAGTQENALQSSVNTTTGKFRITGRYVDGLSSINAPGERESIYFGPDSNNFIRLSAEYVSGQRTLVVYKEQYGFGSVIRQIPLSVNPPVLDLILDFDSATRTVSASYSYNNGAIASIQSGISAPSSWFTTTSKAGVSVSHGSGSAFVAKLDRFSIVRA